MPATHFFLMLHESLLIRADHYEKLCEIQAIAICDYQYYKEMKAKYAEAAADKKPELPPKPPEIKGELAPDQAKAQIFHLAMIAKGGA